MGYKGYWDTHPEHKERLEAKLREIADKVTSWRELARATKETVDVLKYFCRKYNITTPNMKHGGDYRRNYELSGNIGRSIEESGCTICQE